jgi:hypothetical protein
MRTEPVTRGGLTGMENNFIKAMKRDKLINRATSKIAPNILNLNMKNMKIRINPIPKEVA